MAEWFSDALIAALCIYGALLLFCLIRALRGPDMADRVIAINMIGTIVIAAIVVLSIVMDEAYLLDMALVYAMLNFMATVLLCRSYVGVFRARKKRKEGADDE